MIVLILALLAGCVPSLIVFFWLRNYLNKENALYKKNCDRMLASGFLTTFPVVLFSGCTVILLSVSGVKSAHPVLHAALHAFIALALIIFICKNKNNPKYTEPLGQKSDI